MTTLTINTHAAYKELVGNGFAEKQAESIVRVIESVDLSHLATRQDIRELEHKLEKLEYRLSVKVGAIMLALLSFFKGMERFWG